MPNILKLILALLICYAAAAIGGFATAASIENWYSTINKPSFNPPNWLFGPVWSLLYTLMAVTLFLFWKQKPDHPFRNQVILFFMIQLALNSLWSFLFFYFENPGLAFVEIILLWILILLTILKGLKVNRAGALLMIPYLLWVSFASLLNGAIWYLN